MARSRISAADLKPMLATLTDAPFDDADWLYELKWDGYRLIAHRDTKLLTLVSRNGLDVSKKYPEICSALAKLPAHTVLDGELVALDKSGKPSFQLMQNVQRSKAALVFYAFDILFHKGTDVRCKTLLERKKMLKKLLPRNAYVRFSEHVRTKGTEFFEAAEKQGLEGVMAKRCASLYFSGTRSKEWLKIKTSKRQEAVVIGYTKPRNSRKWIGSLILAVHESGPPAGGWQYVGHTGGSLGGRSLKDVYDELQPLKTKNKAADVPREVEKNATWVKPKMIVEVKFTEWTESRTMRHPIVVGFRTDKKPTEVTSEKEIPHKEASEDAGVSGSFAGRRAEKERPASTRGRDPETSASSEVKFSNLEKIYWPQEKFSKGDVISYYNKMADLILPYLKDRPMVLNRHPNGITKPGFFQKDTSDLNLPDFVEATMVHSESNDKELRYVLVNNKETLLYIANLGCIELNPWNSRVGSLDKPDFYVIDLDPGDNTFEEVIEVAKVTHEVLKMACEESYPKTSGKTGIHIYIPLRAKYTYDRVREFAGLLVQIVHRKLPNITSVERSPAKRKKKIYLDWLQNRIGQTLAAPYSLRPAPGATVSTPLEWKEIKKGLSPLDFTIENIEKRVRKKGDLWEPILGKGVDLHESIRCLEAEIGV